MHPTDTNEVNNYFLKTERNDDGSCVLKNGKFDHESLRVAISLFLLGGSHASTFCNFLLVLNSTIIK
jgi:hypothetical protein